MGRVGLSKKIKRKGVKRKSCKMTVMMTNTIHQMQNCLEEDRAQMLVAQIIEEEEEDCPVGEYNGEVLNFDGNQEF